MADGAQPQAESMQRVTQQLTLVLQSRNEIASAARQIAGHVSGARQTRLLALGRWFERPVTPQDVLGRAEALSICLPLMQHAEAGSLQRSQIDDAVRHGCDRLQDDSPRTRRLIARLVYPLAILILCSLVLAVICVLLIPEFERMFDEFGLMLPAPTLFIIWVSHQVQDWGLIVLALFVLVAILLGVSFVHHRRGERSAWSCWLTGLITSTHGALAAWASHVGMLIETGVTQGDAVAIAGVASCKSWLRQASAAWADQIRAGGRPFDHFNQLHGRPCQLLVYAMRSNDFAEQGGFLQDVATIYRDRDQHASSWWLVWFSPVIVCLVGGSVGFTVVALFMPLVSLITGLS